MEKRKTRILVSIVVASVFMLAVVGPHSPRLPNPLQALSPSKGDF